MENQNLQLSPNLAYKAFKIYIIKRDDPIFISLSEYTGILNALNMGKNFVKIGWNIIMLNSISIIEPIERPKQITDTRFDKTGIPYSITLNQKEIENWKNIFEKENK